MSGAPAAAEGGIDVPLPAGTPIYALGTGTLQGYGNFTHPNGSPGYGVLTERTNVPGLGPTDLYYQHMDLANNFIPCINGSCNNQIVTQGEIIGYSRADPGEVEVGFNPGWSGVWGDASSRPGPWITDPRPYLSALATGGSGPDTGTGGSVLTPAFWTGLTSHIFLFLIALAIIMVGFLMLISKPLKEGAAFAEKGVFL